MPINFLQISHNFLYLSEKMRKETDFLGEETIPNGALYGIHALRAKQNFPDSTPFQIEWYRAVGIVKQAYYYTYKSYKTLVKQKYANGSIPLQFFDDNVISALILAADEVAAGKHFEHFIVPAIQGGAGTSINLNINEILANRALQLIGSSPGNYQLIDPIEQANIFQSTNDVIPTSLKIALMKMFILLEEAINGLRFEIEKLENVYRYKIRMGYTQMQEAVPTTFGRLFSTYNDALSRDWWRVSKCNERIKIVNIGGSAIGTALTIPRFFVMEVVQQLQKLTGLPLTRAENLADATSNHDSLVEVHGILKAHAVNLEKIASDIRLLGSDLTNNQLSIPKRQVGSSIMPGKVNPVISEFVISVSHKVYANDSLITSLVGQGCLELNAYLPVIGYALIDSVKLLIGANQSMQRYLFKNLSINITDENIYHKPTIVTVLLPYIGYHKANKLAHYMQEKKVSVFEANQALNLLDQSQLESLLNPASWLKEGFTLDDFTIEK